MNIRSRGRRPAATSCIVVAAALCGCATTGPHETSDPQVASAIAVLYFNNDSVTGRAGRNYEG